MIYYDMIDDPAGLGSEIDNMVVGDVFNHDGKDWVIIEIDLENERFLLEQEEMPYD